MAGTKEGGMKASAKNRAIDPDFYRKIGRKGGSKSHPETRAFSLDPELAKRAGAIGGKISKRGKSKK